MNALAKKHCQNLRQTYRPRQRWRNRAPSEAKYLFTMPKNETDRRRQTPPAKTCFHEHPDPANPTGPFHTPGVGGGERVRTDDLLLAKQVLSQLSYAPIRGQTSGIRDQVFSDT